jgi:hypothetical protein
MGPGRRPSLDAEGKVTFPPKTAASPRFTAEEIAVRAIIAIVIAIVLLTKI